LKKFICFAWRGAVAAFEGLGNGQSVKIYDSWSGVSAVHVSERIDKQQVNPVFTKRKVFRRVGKETILGVERVGAFGVSSL